MSLTVILPTRGRPELLVYTLQEMIKHIREPDTRIVVSVDDDDQATLELIRQLMGPRIVWSVEPRPDSVAKKFNRGAQLAPADVYIVTVDYAPIVTDGFDTKILEAAKIYPDGYAFITDHLATLMLSHLHGVTHKLFERMGGIFPEHFPYWFVDHWFEEMAKRTGRQVFCDVRTESSRRPGTIGKYEPHFWGTLFGCLAGERAALADSIIDSPDFDETPARKRALKNNYPLIDEWSGTMNDLLRRDTGVPVDPKDLAYARLRAKAAEIIGARAPEGTYCPPTSIFVATPMIAGTCYGAYTDSMMKLQRLCDIKNVPLKFFPIFSQSHIDTARNVCADEFLKSGFTHLMFIDSDISFDPSAVFDLLEAEKDIVCGFYPKKRINWKKIVEAVKNGYADKDPEILAHFVGDMVFTPALNDDSNRERTIYDLALLHEGGTGFMLIRREVFEHVEGVRYEKTGPGSEQMTSFFDAKVVFDQYMRHLTEDYDFCRRAREAGYEIWLAPWIKLTHHGYYQFIGNVVAIAAASQPKEARAA